jgi:enoyl-CoA hydratase
MIGDIVKFVSVNPYRLIVTGRTKHYISAFGEHVIGEEVEDSLLNTSTIFQRKIIEFTVAPMIQQGQGKSYHEWFIEFDELPADISEFAHFTVDQGAQLAKQGQELLFDFVENLRTPVIAAVNGFALGGGLELAMSCHFRIASDNAKMGLPEVSLGVIPGYGGTQRLPQLVGKGRAMELIMTAGMIDAETAKSYGLVNHVVPQAELLEFTKGIATKISRNSPTAISQAIKAVNANFKDGLDGYKTEIKSFGKCFGTEDFKEGTTAFLEKRKPSFTGK